MEQTKIPLPETKIEEGKMLLESPLPALSEPLRKMLREIVESPISNSAFCGMVFNKYIDCILAGQPIGADVLISQALMIKAEARKMSGAEPIKDMFNTKTNDEVVVKDVRPKVAEKPKLKLVL